LFGRDRSEQPKSCRAILEDDSPAFEGQTYTFPHRMRKTQALPLGDAMPDDTSKTGNDRKLISLEQDYEVRDWTQSLGCTEDELRAAVKAVGNSAEKVREYLQKK
jgi:hypothetical protein